MLWLRFVDLLGWFDVPDGCVCFIWVGLILRLLLGLCCYCDAGCFGFGYWWVCLMFCLIWLRLVNSVVQVLIIQVLCLRRIACVCDCF